MKIPHQWLDSNWVTHSKPALSSWESKFTPEHSLSGELFTAEHNSTALKHVLLSGALLPLWFFYSS